MRGRCSFCKRSPAPGFPLTACDGDPKDTRSWRRAVLPLCARCHRLLARAGFEGRLRKGATERWYLGHTVGILDSTGAPRPYSWTG